MQGIHLPPLNTCACANVCAGRYAELSGSLLQLRNQESAEMLDHSLQYMRTELERAGAT